MDRVLDGKLAPEVAAAAADWFSRLQEEGAAERDFQAWQRWLNEAPEHRRAYREIERAWRLIGEVQSVPVARQPASRQTWRPWAMAASVLVMVAASWYWVAGWTEAYATRTAEQRSILLPDGSRVTLGARSKVTPVFDETARRIVLNYGEAFFEVAQDPRRPFTVKVGASEIRALGTAFNVHATSEQVLVSVTEGRVAVVSAAKSSNRISSGTAAPEVLLSAGEQVALRHGGAVESKKPAAGAVTWLQGRLEYRGEELRHIIDDLNRYTDRRIVLTDEALGSLRYSGTVFPDHLDEWLQGIGGVLPVAVHDVDGRREISGAP